MLTEDIRTLQDDLHQAVLAGATNVGILGLTPVTLRLVESLLATGISTSVTAIYAAGSLDAYSLIGPIPVRPWHDLRSAEHDVIVVAADEEKEDLLVTALSFIQGVPKVIVAGYGHLALRDPVYHEERNQLLVPSLANGYRWSRVHLYQCLQSAARLGLTGVVAEIGMFKGGTTMFLSRIIERLGAGWPVIGFDTFSGFPARRSPLDMYDHPDCVFTDLSAVRRYLADRNIEIVPGDIVETCDRLAGEDLILTFVDTDNYTSARATIDVVRERTVVNGAIVFDHVAGEERFRNTLGERLAAMELRDDPRYFHLHGTGVFLRQR